MISSYSELETTLNALEKTVNSKSEQIQNQVKEGGLGPLANNDLLEIERLLKGRKITRLKGGKNQTEWNEEADKYKKMISDELNAVLAGSRNYGEKSILIRDGVQYLTLLEPKIQNRIDTIQPFKKSLAVIGETVDTYKKICNKGEELANIDSNIKFTCDNEIKVENEELGRFTHTFKSVRKYISDSGTLFVIFICLLIDFIIPLAMFSLLRNNEVVTPTFFPFGKKPNVPNRL